MQKPDVDTLTIINLKRKLENNPHCNTTMKNKMSKNKFNQGGKRLITVITTLLKGIKEDTYKWKDKPHSWIRRQYC